MGLIDVLVRTPAYPHWLEELKKARGDRLALAGLRGDVLEVGAGDGARKQALLREHPLVDTYLATDDSVWDKEFERFNTMSRIKRKVLGYQARHALDGVCSATDLPYEDASFDFHLSFEVLEHIGEPERYFAEAARVLRPGGRLVFSVPFLYRMHGGEPDHPHDYFRYTFGSFRRFAEQNGMSVELLHHNTGYGTTYASLSNQWFVQLIKQGRWPTRILLTAVSPFYFALNGLVGYLVDLRPDNRFATRYHVVMRKPQSATAT